MEKDLKSIHFTIERDLYERFYRSFPRRGEMKIVFRTLMEVAIELRERKEIFMKIVEEEIERKWNN